MSNRHHPQSSRTLRRAKRPLWTAKKLALAVVAVIAAEFVAFTDFDGAKADDVQMFIVGGGATVTIPPPNIMFIFDSSVSMRNLVCEDLDAAGGRCSVDELTAYSPAVGVSICINAGLNAVRPADLDANGVADPYSPVYNEVLGLPVFSGAHYPMLNAAEGEVQPASAYTHTKDADWTELESGAGVAVVDFETVISDTCARIADCEKRSRCIFSLKTRGYFWEPAGALATYGCGDGDPTGMCAAVSCGDATCSAGVENFCNCPADCDLPPLGVADAATAGNGCCETGLENYVTAPTDCKLPLGEICATDSDCESAECQTVSGVSRCSECANNGDCPGNCISTSCTYKYCDDSACFISVCNNDLVCDVGPGETHVNCPGDCPCSGDGVSCDAGETDANCPSDCGCDSDGSCEAGRGETVVSCAADCAVACVANGVCNTPIENDVNCPIDCGCNSNGTCEAVRTETVASCAADCGCDSDGSCEAGRGETNANCAADCPCNSNGTCAGGETVANCPSDCGCDSDGSCEAGRGELYSNCFDCPAPARKLGATCGNGGDCDSGKCTNLGGAYGKRCSTCSVNSNCTSGICGDLLPPSCAQPYRACTSYQVCNPGGGGGAPAPLATTALAASELLLSAPPVAAGDITTPVYLGDFLNAYPAKGRGLVAAFQAAITSMGGDARMGIMDYANIGRNNLGHDIKPPCSHMGGADCFDGDPSTMCFNPSDPDLQNYLSHLDFDVADSQPAMALDWAGQYFSTDTGMDTPICDYSALTTCDTNNFIVLVSDGGTDNDAAAATDVAWANGNVGITDGYAGGAANGSFLDDVAKALTRIDHRSSIDEEQTIGTYTVSYGPTDATGTRCTDLLQTTATHGGGKCLPATNVEQLESVLSNIIDEIIKRVAGFTSPALPTTRFTSTASLANAVFRPSTSFPLWEGHMYAFRICDEQIARVTGDACDCFSALNANEVCIQDEDGAEIVYDDDGNLISKPYWDAQLCLSGDVDNIYGPLPSDQNDLDVAACFRTSDETAANKRLIYTAYDADADGTIETAERIEFTAANAATLQTPMTTATAARAEHVIRFYRGQDVDDADGDTNTLEDRNLSNMTDATGTPIEGWWKLGDIFHSIPNATEHPTGKGLGTWARSASYLAYAADNVSRPRVILVGANDGMLHAIQAGTWDAGTGRYDQGTGEELWAFVTPESLAKIEDACDPGTGGCAVQNHQYLVDGSVMVRDIWVGGAADKNNVANKTMWKTIAVVGHRDGGRTYVALDITDVSNPQFLWQFPQPGSPLLSQMGNSWLDTFPAPAAIGPVREDSDMDGTFEAAEAERWVALINGGFDQHDEKGTGFFMLDAYSGVVKFRAWKNLPVASETVDMNYSFAATPVFYADMSGPLPYMAGVVAVDHGGQIWHMDVSVVTPTVINGPYDLEPELFFRAISAIDTDNEGGNGDNRLDADEYQRRPFFFSPTLTRNGGKVRVLLGSGDRDMLIPHPNIHPLAATTDAINDYICNDGDDDEDTQRLYAIDLVRCATLGTPRPCTEADLVEADGSTAVSANARGWFFKLGLDGEKSATPHDIFAGYGMYATFVPTVACGGAADVCSPDSKGFARLYALHYLTGTALDYDNDATTTATYIETGEGVPSAPAVSAGVAGGTVTPTVFAGGSDTGLTSQTLQELGGSLVLELMRFPVSPELHTALHP